MGNSYVGLTLREALKLMSADGDGYGHVWPYPCVDGTIVYGRKAPVIISGYAKKLLSNDDNSPYMEWIVIGTENHFLYVAPPDLEISTTTRETRIREDIDRSMNAIDSFDGKYRFLSNYYASPSQVYYEGRTYGSVEAAFHAQKSPERAFKFTSMDSSQAKKYGRRVPLRPDWEDVKDNIMYELVRYKFFEDPRLGEQLLGTGNAELIEGNSWGDRYWGVCDGVGENHLGLILMRVREELRNDGRFGT